MAKDPLPGTSLREDCGTVNKFLARLDPRRKNWQGRFVFRGVASESFKLAPTALRKTKLNDLAIEVNYGIFDDIIYNKIPKTWIVEFVTLRKLYHKLKRKLLIIIK